jgi:hypothetical protein
VWATQKACVMDEPTSWAEEEFGAAALGDVRRTARLVQLAAALGAQPQASLPQATDDPALLKAAYRFFGSGYVQAEAVLASHVQSTQRRLQTVPLVLAVQDTSLLDYSHYPDTVGVGPLASATQQGLVVHTTLALTPEHVPLGLLAQQVWARDADGHQQDHKTRPLAAKESQKWLTSLDAVIAARAACPDTQFVSGGDREADVYDLFLVARPAGVDLLIRAAQNRTVDGPDSLLWAAMATAPVAATVAVQVGARGAQPARLADVTVRWRQVTLRPPKHRVKEQLPRVTVWAVWAVERLPPPGVAPVEWLLLTTVAVTTTAEALERLAWYAARWGIEVWHKVLKSGCQIEQKQLGTAYRLTNCLTLYSVIAWRIMYATMLARAVPEAPCTVLLDDAEWHGLYCRIHRVAIAPARPPSLRQAVRWIGQLGGFQGRTGDGEPGVQAMWHGFQRLADIAEMYRIMHQNAPNTPTPAPD